MVRNVEHYFWIVGLDELGKTYLIKGGNSEEQARRVGFDRIPGDFKIVDLPTMNLKTAYSLHKGKHYGS
jgi:hypothetical protein